MPGKVADASVVAALAFQEPDAAKAAAMLEGGDLYAPSLLAYELVSVAGRKIRKTPALRQELEQGLESVLAMGFKWTEPDHADVLSLSLATGLSAYDSAYFSLARALKADLVTFDKDLNAAWKRLNKS